MQENENWRKSNPGEDNGNARLTETDVLRIRRFFALGWKHREIAEEFSISLSSVGKIVNRKSWRHI
jgi:DNA invertase Pin-like site-specific DNA recombinase